MEWNGLMIDRVERRFPEIATQMRHLQVDRYIGKVGRYNCRWYSKLCGCGPSTPPNQHQFNRCSYELKSGQTT